MTDDQMKEKDFKVEDRRTSADTEGEEKKPPEPQEKTGSGEEMDSGPSHTGDPGDTLKVDFSTFI